MTSKFHLRKIARLIRSFCVDRRGQIAVTFALSAVGLLTAVGIGLDVSNAYVVRQELSHAALLTCQYSVRPAVVSTVYNGSSGQATYISNVNSSAQTFLAAENFKLTQGNASPFTYSPGGASAVSLNTSMPTMFVGMFGVNTIPLGVSVNCANGQISPTETQSAMVIQESFETPACSGYCWNAFAPDGTIRISPAVTTGFPKTVGYTGATGNQWEITGYCLEIDSAGITVPTAADGSHVAELDCDNGSGSAGNSAISNKAYFTAGTYELRYNFEARIGYPNYAPTYICGSTATDVAWANDTNSTAGAKLRTNQINVYFDADNNGAPGMHTTMDGSETLAGSNLIDECVYSSGWIERSVKINVTTPGYYWTTFAGDGANDSYGGALDNIRLCRTSCSGTVQDNFPSLWTSGKKLFEDTFESPVYTQDPYTSSAHAKGGNLAVSYGTSGATSGWPSQAVSGWAVAPYNQVNFWMQGATQGNQYISLQGWNGFSNPLDPINRSISRGFYLDPGYYSVSYNYVSLAEFSYSFVYSNGYFPICTGYPTSAPSYNAYGTKTGRNYPDYLSGTLYNQYLSTNFMNVYMANGASVSTPNVNATLGGAVTYTNPDGTVTATPTTPLDNASNFTAYNASAANPVIQTCFYSGAYVWTRQTIYVKIVKPGRYWLAFSALGDPLTGTGAGPGLDDIVLTSLNSPYGTTPSSFASIPAPGPAPGSTISYTGFSITADPFAP